MKLSYRHAAVIALPAIAIGALAFSSSPSRDAHRITSHAESLRPTTTVVDHAPSLPRAPLATTSVALDTGALANRPAAMTARGRKGWLVADLLERAPGLVMHALAADGRDIPIDDDAILVRRDNGELYVGFLAPGADRSRPLADIERPSERIEGVVRLHAEAPAAAPPLAPPADLPSARIAVLLDGAEVKQLDKQAFVALATTQITGTHGSQAAIDLGAAFHARAVSVEADGAHVELTPPARDARPVIVMNRRERFKLAWVDASGTSIGDKQREVTQVAMRR